jgi:hypothetical protein
MEKHDVTFRLSMHLNYGSAGHSYVYEVFVKDEVVGQRSVRTGKEPLDIFEVKGKEYDLRKGDKDGLFEWLQEQLSTKEQTQ